MSNEKVKEIISVKQVKDLIIRKDRNLNFKYSFNTTSGVSIRSDLLNAYDKPTGNDPFMASFPHMVDVGIMGSCEHGKSGLCLKAKVECYQNGLDISKPNMSLENFVKIAIECKDVVNQFALGGRGDPDEHENFEEILKICKENNIVPNYTTSGYSFSNEKAELSKKYCGAVAVSWYRNDYTYKTIDLLINAGVKTNIHYVVNNDTIDEAINLLKNEGFPKGINAVIFLTHKPVGLGTTGNILNIQDLKVRKFIDVIIKEKFAFKIGVDGCFVVGFISTNQKINYKFLDTCEAARFTCYISSDMLMYPCSFDINGIYAVSLDDKTILEAWNSDEFNLARRNMKTRCLGCNKRGRCKGGCFICRDIILCDEINKGVIKHENNR